MYESLLSEAYEEQVEVVYFPLTERIKGLYYNNTIAINNTLTTAEKTCILAEELGHYHTSAGDILALSPGLFISVLSPVVGGSSSSSFRPRLQIASLISFNRFLPKRLRKRTISDGSKGFS